jgi:capsular polysaccharide biosynthesis protein
MKRFSRCVLILILVAILSGVGGYMYENKMIYPMYESTTQLYVVPGEENEASIRANNGGLKEDFTIIFKSSVVISAAQRVAGTSEDIAQYLTVSSPANSNIVEIKCVNPDQNTAKKYVDAVATTAVKTTSIIPVKSIQILSEGTSTGVAFKPDLYRNTIIITAIASAVCLFIEIIVCLCISAFKSKDEDFNHEFEYERRFGNVEYIDHKPDLIETSKDKKENVLKHSNKKNKDEDILINIEDEKQVYEAGDEEDLDEDILREAAQDEDILKDTDTIEEAEDEADYEAQAEVAATISEDNAGTQLDNANKNVKPASASTVQSASVEAPVSTGQSVSVEAPVDAEQSSSAEVPARTETLASAVEVEKPVQEVKAAESVNEADQSAQEADAASQKANVVSEPVVTAVGVEVDKAQVNNAGNNTDLNNNTDIKDSEEVNSESRKFRILGTIRK